MRNLVWLVLFILLVSCVKESGVGGGAKIKGKIVVNDYNSIGTLVSEYDAQDYDVFIIYGNDDNIVDDEVKTSYDGSFEFDFLRTGDYTVFVYSDCVNCPNGSDSVIVKNITIDNNKEEINLSDIIVRQ